MSAAAPSCRSCRHFDGRALPLEASLPLIASLSSVHGSSRSDDGICAHHDRFVSADARCAAHAV